MLHDKGRVQALTFKETAYQLVNKSDASSWGAAVNVVFSALFVEKLSGFLTFKVLGEWFTKAFFKFFHHGDSSPRWCEINFKFFLGFGWIWVELDFVVTSQLFDHFGEHVFSEVEQVIVVSIGHIELATSVLRVVSLIDRFVSEVLTDFEDSV